ncbi:MAG: UDP-N-acetylglucosamine--N-acetylmuramyl-(pentapeptide) pyrophosphoryl-undecaprenol N-acetylglucosamine transferase [Candidatus Ozemobacter sibiricus]|uniref:UDP-N-acetylglucosamine--N-acetylmuramyl-(pentapeptide) pyrophosphoryl-undecaprenol N-acetylglucosamine transferase n=1 Tax=Candidatus Ozemobacter sibiricus TaxID=2268124 RepID=A0A367ZS00_9BACT|nr:MAG: UDP-N-acetylglucosamine--N-acetylmuramyl-(pentapeptide) pyrophosphoryl-undecaprenol N-acetylglucosamine transferase [Candidatus Ozemobacter sibiricus]
MKKVLLAGGGTGGHIYPALAIREILREHLPGAVETAYMGQPDGMEAAIVRREADLPFLPVRAQGLPRTLSTRWLTFPWRNAQGLWDAVTHTRAYRPDLVIATGGFVAFPALLAARLLGIPYAIHEQNAAIGVTNRLFAGAAARVLLTYREAYAGEPPRVVVTGNPVRRAFLVPAAGPGRFRRAPGEFWVLIVGGSRGARSLNEAAVGLPAAWWQAHPTIRLLHITGERDYADIEQRVSRPDRHQVLPYLHEMREAFDLADLVVSRAGATILAELAVCGKPAILVPYPHATDNHQEKNARTLAERGAARLVLDRELSPDLLGAAIVEAMTSGDLPAMGRAMAASRPPDVERLIWEALQPLLADASTVAGQASR